MNSSSAPGINSAVDEPGRTPYQVGQQVFISSPVGCVLVNFTAVPENHRLMVMLTIGALALTAPGAPLVQLAAAAPGTRITGFLAPSAPFETVFDVPIVGYFDAGQVPQLFVQPDGSSQLTSAYVGLTGYMIDGAAAPCAPLPRE